MKNTTEYIRDNCVFREESTIYERLSAQIKYKNKTFQTIPWPPILPFEMARFSINGTKGRIEAQLDNPVSRQNGEFESKRKCTIEMSQSGEGTRS